jgi:hypothetical protein
MNVPKAQELGDLLDPRTNVAGQQSHLHAIGLQGGQRLGHPGRSCSSNSKRARGNPAARNRRRRVTCRGDRWRLPAPNPGQGPSRHGRRARPSPEPRPGCSHPAPDRPRAGRPPQPATARMGGPGGQRGRQSHQLARIRLAVLQQNRPRPLRTLLRQRARLVGVEPAHGGQRLQGIQPLDHHARRAPAHRPPPPAPTARPETRHTGR